MSSIVDERIKDNHTTEEYVTVRNLFSNFFMNLFKKYLLLKFPIYDLKRI